MTPENWLDMTGTRLNVRRARPLLGTFVEIAVAGETLEAAEAAVDQAFSAVATVHRLMSFHETDSDVSRLNRDAAEGAVRVHDWTYQVLDAAGDLYRRSGGVFDISVAPALQRLGLLPDVPGVFVPFGDAGPAGAPPHPDPLHSPSKTGVNALNAGGEREQRDTHDPVQLLPDNRVRFADPSVKVDLGGIAKGFAVDRAVEALRRHGAAEGLVNAGGDLRVFGPRSHLIDIRNPRQPDRPLCRVALADAALASSGRRFDPLRSHHVLNSAVIDPSTAMPVRSITGATVCAPCCVIADALTKVVINAAEAAGPMLNHYGADALFVSAHGEIHMTADWKNEVHLAA